jgi:hypothetical protein
MQQLEQVAHHGGHREHHRLVWHLPAEGEELLGDPRGPFPGPDHLLEVGRHGAAGRELPLRHVAEAEHDGEHVVDLVGHAAGQAADRLDPLPAALLLLRPRPLLQVAPHLVLPGAGAERGMHRAQERDRLHRALQQCRVGAFQKVGQRTRWYGRRAPRRGQHDHGEVRPGRLGGQMTGQDAGGVLLQPLLGEHDDPDRVVQPLAQLGRGDRPADQIALGAQQLGDQDAVAAGRGVDHHDLRPLGAGLKRVSGHRRWFGPGAGPQCRDTRGCRSGRPGTRAGGSPP